MHSFNKNENFHFENEYDDIHMSSKYYKTKSSGLVRGRGGYNNNNEFQKIPSIMLWVFGAIMPIFFSFKIPH